MHFLSWGSYFWWMDSRSETAGLGDAYAVHFGRCLQIAFQRACHNSYSHQQDVKWPFPASQPLGILAFLESKPPAAQECILSARSVGHPRGWAGAAGSSRVWKSSKNAGWLWRQDPPTGGAGSWTWGHAGDLALVTLPEWGGARGSYCARMNLRGRRREVPLKWLLLHWYSWIVEYQEYYGYCVDLSVFWLSHHVNAKLRPILAVSSVGCGIPWWHSGPCCLLLKTTPVTSSVVLEPPFNNFLDYCTIIIL